MCGAGNRSKFWAAYRQNGIHGAERRIHKHTYNNMYNFICVSVCISSTLKYIDDNRKNWFKAHITMQHARMSLGVTLLMTRTIKAIRSSIKPQTGQTFSKLFRCSPSTSPWKGLNDVHSFQMFPLAPWLELIRSGSYAKDMSLLMAIYSAVQVATPPGYGCSSCHYPNTQSRKLQD